ncbi:unnamed protein product [Bursaphelenchus okinawaensis]|uniref:Uncharacterized protein n=1 Tax=Bursaphelenchus okinawaensis TaxID=465554 RepID=A0A811LBV5_9BILA|nr:unnamed protein product [Bursaphelenchus okinawaensis]CAG9121176.1 unnamed protein product [Bursaphelenchus okinawaensis]
MDRTRGLSAQVQPGISTLLRTMEISATEEAENAIQKLATQLIVGIVEDSRKVAQHCDRREINFQDVKHVCDELTEIMNPRPCYGLYGLINHVNNTELPKPSYTTGMPFRCRDALFQPEMALVDDINGVEQVQLPEVEQRRVQQVQPRVNPRQGQQNSGNLLQHNFGTPLRDNVGTPLRTNIGTPMQSIIGTPLQSNIGTPLQNNIGNQRQIQPNVSNQVQQRLQNIGNQVPRIVTKQLQPNVRTPLQKQVNTPLQAIVNRRQQNVTPQAQNVVQQLPYPNVNLAQNVEHRAPLQNPDPAFEEENVGPSNQSGNRPNKPRKLDFKNAFQSASTMKLIVHNTSSAPNSPDPVNSKAGKSFTFKK